MRTDSVITKQSEDLLDRYDFAKEIVSGLLSSFKSGQHSISVSINGEWGSGKSSILSFIESEIKNQTSYEPKRNIVFKFNPWMITGQAELQKSFLTQLGLFLRTINPELKKLGGDIIRIANFLELISSFNPEFFTQKALKSGSKLVKLIAKRIGNEPSVEELKNKIDKLLETSTIKLFIIIDDIDRLGSREIAEIFRLVKLNASFKNTFFFLAFDKRFVSKALEKEFHVNGEQFLEKIIQLDYSIPKLLPETIEDFFISNINQFSKNQNTYVEKVELNRLWKSGLKDFYGNLRHIYRLFNSLEVRYPGVKNDVNILDFVVIETIRLFEYETFEWIYKNKETLTADRVFESSFNTNVNTPTFATHINNLEFFKEKQRSKPLIISIFNSIHFSPISMGNESLDQTKLEIEKRVAHSVFFEHYFAFKIPKSNIPHIYVDTFMVSNSEQRKAILDKYLKNNFKLFLQRIKYHLSPELFNLELINQLLDYSDNRNLHTETIDYRYQYGLYVIIDFLNELSYQFSYHDYLRSILSKNDSYSRFILQNYLQNVLLNKSNIEPVKDFPKDLIEKEKEAIRKALRQSIKTHSKLYLTEPLKYDISIVWLILHLLHQEYPDLYRIKISEYLTDVNLSVMLFQCSQKSVTENGITTYYAFDEKSLLPELTIEKINKALTDADIKIIDNKLKDFYLLFEKQKEAGFKTNQYYSKDLKPWRR